jgi:hypothetical protein
MLPLALIATLLAACGPSDKEAASALPYAPADLQHCFREAVGVPDKALTVAEVESLWKQDRVRLAINKRCGERMIAWYSTLQRNWK